MQRHLTSQSIRNVCLYKPIPNMEEKVKLKRKSLVVATVSAMFAASAQAQSSVTLYGVADAGIEYVSHAGLDGTGSAYRVSSDNTSGSRWGLRGKEDLGGGLSAVFVLESGFSIDTGTMAQGGRLFGRQAFVGISSHLGQITLGRQNNTLFDLFAGLDPLRYATYSLLSQDAQFAGRPDNSVKYTGNFGALTITGLYSAGYDSNIANGTEVPGSPRVGQEMGAGASYTSGNLGMAIAYDQRRGTSVLNASAVERRYVASLIYTTGPFSAVAGYRYLQGGLTPTTGIRSNLYWVGGGYAITPALRLNLGVYYTDRRDSPSDSASYVLQTQYAFSKRTDLYVNASYMNNKGKSNLGVVTSTTVAPGVSQTGIVAGVRHIF
ncbi:Outer membrane protein (porin) (plasmid) [Cupriavidus metallidurans CH34]|uniref:Outer membrane protein (Porin) n=2 Tax=Cupriavidus metallidurans TaxID=119219 RepID=Q1LFH0_CUPMC|nr:Outer membrane protein (porin) [Cupriavidus metallidurans CH34]